MRVAANGAKGGDLAKVVNVIAYVHGKTGDAGAGQEKGTQVIHRPASVDKGSFGSVSGDVGHPGHVPGGVDTKASARCAAEGAEILPCRPRPSHCMIGTGSAGEVGHARDLPGVIDTNALTVGADDAEVGWCRVRPPHRMLEIIAHEGGPTRDLPGGINAKALAVGAA